MSARAKGQRTELKAVRYALSFPGVKIIRLYQVSRWAQPQPADMIVFAPHRWPILVEVRSNQWRISRPSTLDLVRLPGEGFFCQLWLFKNGATTPQIRRWVGGTQLWQGIDSPWEASA